MHGKVTRKQIEFGDSLGLDLRGRTKKEASASIQRFLDDRRFEWIDRDKQREQNNEVRRFRVIEKKGLKPGMRVRLEGTDQIISSINCKGYIFFKREKDKKWACMSHLVIEKIEVI